MPTIRITSLKVNCIIGIHPHERVKQQEILLDIALRGEWAEAIQHDSFEHALDYDAVAREAIEILQSGKFQLIEAAAGALVEKCLSYPGVRGATVRVSKPGAIPAAQSASFEITRGEDS